MNLRKTSPISSMVYYRLIAIWVLNEALLGGIIHGLKIPVSGLFVGGCAVICISLIGWYVPVKGAILRATIIVAIFKMMLSPQAPPTAYIAVLFQGALGELLFLRRNFYRFGCFILAMLALVESGFQRIVTLTIIYGKDFWTAVDSFLSGLTGQKAITPYSFILGGGYLLLHLIAGLLVGGIASRMPVWLEHWRQSPENKMVVMQPSPDENGQPRRRKWIKTSLLAIWIFLLLLYFQSAIPIGKPLLPSQLVVGILVRSILIVLGWMVIVGPVLRKLLRSWLEKKRSKFSEEVRQVVSLLPVTRQLLQEAWKRTYGVSGLERWRRFSRLALVNALDPVSDKAVVILSGPVQTGKTTAIMRWADQRKDVVGVLSPVVDGKRMFVDLHNRQLFPMEATTDHPQALRIGRFAFDPAAFFRAQEIIRNHHGREGWMVIDEIGPLELNRQGFHDVLSEVLGLAENEQRLLLVVREGLTGEVVRFFDLKNVVVIDPAELQTR